MMWTKKRADISGLFAGWHATNACIFANVFVFLLHWWAEPRGYSPDICDIALHALLLLSTMTGLKWYVSYKTHHKMSLVLDFPSWFRKTEAANPEVFLNVIISRWSTFTRAFQSQAVVDFPVSLQDGLSRMKDISLLSEQVECLRSCWNDPWRQWEEARHKIVRMVVFTPCPWQLWLAPS
jgi:hypothetical protein